MTKVIVEHVRKPFTRQLTDRLDARIRELKDEARRLELARKALTR